MLAVSEKVCSTFRLSCTQERLLHIEILSLLLAWVLVWAVGAVILLIVGRLGLGLVVGGFGSAFIASAVISIVSALITWGLGAIGIVVGGSGLLSALVSLVIAAIVLMIADRFVKGMMVQGFVGALIAAISYGVIAWLLHWLIDLFI